MRRHARGHADGDAGTAVDQKLRKPGRQHDRLEVRAVIVGPHLDGLAAQLDQQFGGELGQARFRVSVGGWRIAIDGAKVALAVDQRHTHGKILRQPDHRIVDGRVAVRVIATDDVTDYLRALTVARIVGQVQVLEHRIEDAAMHRLEAVADIVGEGEGEGRREGRGKGEEGGEGREKRGEREGRRGGRGKGKGEEGRREGGRRDIERERVGREKEGGET